MNNYPSHWPAQDGMLPFDPNTMSMNQYMHRGSMTGANPSQLPVIAPRPQVSPMEYQQQYPRWGSVTYDIQPNVVPMSPYGSVPLSSGSLQHTPLYDHSVETSPIDGIMVPHPQSMIDPTPHSFDFVRQSQGHIYQGDDTPHEGQWHAPPPHTAMPNNFQPQLPMPAHSQGPAVPTNTMHHGHDGYDHRYQEEFQISNSNGHGQEPMVNFHGAEQERAPQFVDPVWSGRNQGHSQEQLRGVAGTWNLAVY
jgi:hypothetical protein